MTFEDFCGLICYDGKHIQLPCTIDDILALGDEFQIDKDFSTESVASIFIPIDDSRFSMVLFGVRDGANMHAQEYAEEACVLWVNFNDGSKFSLNSDLFRDMSTEEVYDVLGTASIEYELGNVYTYYADGYELDITFQVDDNGIFSGVRLCRRKGEV